METNLESGYYIITNKTNNNEQYLLLISGLNPFLKIEAIWDLHKSKLTTDDVMRGKNFDWELQNIK
jgi:hypothetical protein